MSDPDVRLAALLRADRPPVVDSRFRLGVLEGQTRQRLRTRLGLLMVVGGSVTSALAQPAGAEAEDRLALADALANLPLEQRAAVVLCLSEDFSHAEAAAILGLPLGTVKSHISRGRERLLSVLGGRS